MKVLWITEFSNSRVREKLRLSISSIEFLIRKLFNKPQKPFFDLAVWISNGIREFEKFKNVELHIISPHYGMAKSIDSFQLNGVNYHFFKPDDDSIIQKVKKYFSIDAKGEHKRNRIKVKKLIKNIHPDIIHMYGAENPHYSITALDIDIVKYPFFISLQTLLSDDEFINNYPNSVEIYIYRSNIERRIIERSIYIGSSVQKYRKYIWDNINPEAIFFKTYLAVAEKVEIHNNIQKKFDFVYFAYEISKASDIAIEAFAIANKKYPNITLNIIGNTPQPFTNTLKLRIAELGLEQNVYFSGRLSTHRAVLDQVQLSRYALLPLKVDIISGTIREAMCSGLPVVTAITPGTPSLNEKRLSVLLSDKNDFQAMADNMIQLLENPQKAKELAENALITVQERWNNEKNMLQLIEAYNAIIDHHHKHIEIPTELGTKNHYN